MSKHKYDATGPVGTPVSWSRDLFRITVQLPQELLTQMKITAVKNNRTLSAEVKTRLERTLQDEMEARAT